MSNNPETPNDADSSRYPMPPNRFNTSAKSNLTDNFYKAILKLYKYKIPGPIAKGVTYTAAIAGAVYGFNTFVNTSRNANEAFIDGILGTGFGAIIFGSVTEGVLAFVPNILFWLVVLLPLGFAGVYKYKNKNVDKSNNI